MATLRCTAKLLKRLKVTDPPEPPPAQNRLGDWFANVVFTRDGHFVILVSEHSLLPVLIPARDLQNLVPRFMRALAEVLSALGVPQTLIDHELDRTQPVAFGRTNSRVVLGSMNDFIFSFKYMLPQLPHLNCLEWSLRLAHTPCGPIHMEQPEVLAPRLLRNPHGFELIDGGAS